MNTTDQKAATPVANEPLKTSNYSQFKIIESNRTTSKRHVSELIRSISTHPELLPTRPILVNEKMEVIDGQHRLQACEALGMPVYYTIEAGTDIESAQVINATQRAWEPVAFARSYALTPIKEDDPEFVMKTERKKTYTTFLQLYEQYALSTTIITEFCEGKLNYKGLGPKFKRGELTIRDEQVTRILLDQLLDFRKVVAGRVFSTANFQHAAHSIFQVSGYDHDRMLEKLASKNLEMQINKTEYVRALERIYNLGYTPGSSGYLRFF